MFDSLTRLLDCIQDVKQGGKNDQDTGNRSLSAVFAHDRNSKESIQSLPA